MDSLECVIGIILDYTDSNTQKEMFNWNNKYICDKYIYYNNDKYYKNIIEKQKKNNIRNIIMKEDKIKYNISMFINIEKIEAYSIDPWVLYKLKKLKCLKIHTSPVPIFNVHIKQLTMLEYIFINNNCFVDDYGIRNLKKLRYLQIDCNTSITNSGIKNLKSLQYTILLRNNNNVSIHEIIH